MIRKKNMCNISDFAALHLKELPLSWLILYFHGANNKITFHALVNVALNSPYFKLVVEILLI